MNTFAKIVNFLLIFHLKAQFLTILKQICFYSYQVFEAEVIVNLPLKQKKRDMR